MCVRPPILARAAGGRILLCLVSSLVLAASASAAEFRRGPDLAAARSSHAAALLQDGRVLVAGSSTSAAAWTTELYDPVQHRWQSGPGLGQAEAAATLTTLLTGKVLLVGQGRQLFDPVTTTWSAPAAAATPHRRHTTTLLATGQVLVAGGEARFGGETDAFEWYDPINDSATYWGHLNQARRDHAAVRLNSGKVLFAGGRSFGTTLASVEVFDPQLNYAESSQNGMLAARSGFSLTLLPGGKVLAAGGSDGMANLANAEIYDPASGAWQWTGAMSVPRSGHSATLLPSGQVLVAGGRSGPGGGLREVEIYAPEFDRWTPAPLLLQVRAGHSALLLPSGEVLLAFGYANNWVPLLERYDPGLVPDPTRQPRLYPVDLLAGSYGTVRAAGSGFRPAASADTGSGAGAASNLPLLQLQRIDNGQMRFVAADAALPFSDSLFAGRPRDLAAFPVGPVLVRVWVNGIPSAAVQATQAGVPATTTAPLASGGVRRATVTFAPPNDDGGAPIGGYRVTAVPGAALRTCLAPCSAVDFEDLSPGSYTFTVSAVNIAGAAAASAPSNGVVVQARASVTLTSGDNPSAYGGSVTFTASVAGQAPGGTVTFRADGAVLCADVALAGGIASCATDALAGGLHAIGAGYAGDAGNTAAESAILYQQVDTAASQAVLSSSANPSTYGDSVVLTATITARWLDGHVDFQDGAAPLCLQVALSNGVARCTVNDFAVGTHAITARYGGDGDTGASVSFALAQQVLALPTTTSLATPCRHAFSANQPFTLQATIAAAPLGGTPGGQVDFVADNGATLCAAVPLAGGAASCTTTALAAPAGQGQGNVAIRARYSGDAINAGGSSPDLSVTVLDPADVLLRNGFEAAVAGCPAR